MNCDDHRSDPDEFTNLAGDTTHEATIKRLSKWVPEHGAPEFREEAERN
jgi:hypothetical protein